MTYTAHNALEVEIQGNAPFVFWCIGSRSESTISISCVQNPHLHFGLEHVDRRFSKAHYRPSHCSRDSDLCQTHVSNSLQKSELV